MITQSDVLELNSLTEQLGARRIIVSNKTKSVNISTVLELSDREVAIVLAGGKLTYIRNKIQIPKFSKNG